MEKKVGEIYCFEDHALFIYYVITKTSDIKKEYKIRALQGRKLSYRYYS